MSNQLKNPIFKYLIILIIGVGLGVWGWIKEDCIGTNCWVGSGFIKWSGVALIVIGLAGWALSSNRPKNPS